MDDKLDRKEVGDVAVYSKSRMPNPNQPRVIRITHSKTIVPKGSIQDEQMASNENEDSGVPKRFTSLLKNPERLGGNL